MYILYTGRRIFSLASNQQSLSIYSLADKNKLI